MLPSLILGVFIFLLILLMFQALRLTEFILLHGVSTITIIELMSYMVVSFLPVIFPMSLIFTVLMTYGRLSADSEIIAFRSLGLNMKHLMIPALVLAGFVTLISAETSFYMAPWGNRKFELLIDHLGRLKASATIREGVFSEGFFDLVIYANEVDSNEGHLEKVFIYDERDSDSPLTIIAKEGQIIRQTLEKGQRALLRLIDGNIHRTKAETYTKINFDSYDINLFDPIKKGRKKKSILSHNLDDIHKKLNDPETSTKNKRKYQIELHRRWSLAIACIIFAFIGVGLGTNTNSRSGKSSGFVLSIGLIVAYWVLFVVSENIAKNSSAPAWIVIWSVNAIFSGFAFWAMRRSTKVY